jgi:transposase
VDEAGFAPTLPTGYSWSVVGQPLPVPYEPPSGRRINVIGGYFSHGPSAGRFEFEAWASIPRSKAKQPRKSPQARANDHGLRPEEVGKLDADRVLSFLWALAGRPAGLSDARQQTWKRERPLMIPLDNYSVHHSQTVQDARPLLEAADVYLVYLSSYSPELSEIEPIWRAVKYHEIPVRSQDLLGDLKREVEAALRTKAGKLSAAHSLSPQLLQQPT